MVSTGLLPVHVCPSTDPADRRALIHVCSLPSFEVKELPTIMKELGQHGLVMLEMCLPLRLRLCCLCRFS